MDRQTLMTQLSSKAVESRIEMNSVAARAGVSATILARWRNAGKAPLLPTIKRLEDALAEMEKQAA